MKILTLERIYDDTYFQKAFELLKNVHVLRHRWKPQGKRKMTSRHNYIFRKFLSNGYFIENKSHLITYLFNSQQQYLM
jgi:hypothetical protein